MPNSVLRALHSAVHISLVLFLFSSLLSAQVPVPALPPLDSLPEAEIVNFAQQFVIIATTQRTLADLQWHNVQSVRTTAESELATLKADTTAPKDKLTAQEKNLRSAKNAEKMAQKNAKQAEKNLALAESTVNMDSLARRKSLPKLQRQLTEMYPLLVPPSPVSEPPAVTVAPASTDTTTTPAVAEVPKKDKKPEAPTKKYKTYNVQADVMLHPPTPPCALAMNRRDEFSGETQREAARGELFRYTNPVLKSYLQGNANIICEAALTTTGQNTSLLLTFTIRDPNVHKAFGNLSKNSLATLRTLDGVLFDVHNQELSEGTPDETGQVFTFGDNIHLIGQF